MSTRTIHPSSGSLYFVTFTCYQWIPLFEITNLYDNIYQWFDYLQTNKNRIVAYVIMPNHIHIILQLSHEGKTLNSLIANGKRFMSYEIISRLKQQKQDGMLKKLSDGVPASERKKGKLHHVFETSFDAKHLYDEHITEQKLDYIHRNPVKGEKPLASSSTEYKHSSARFYLEGEQGVYLVHHYLHLGDE